MLRVQHSQVSDVEKGFGVGPRAKQGLYKALPESSRPFLAVRCTQRNTTLSTAFGARNPTTWVRGPLGFRAYGLMFRVQGLGLGFSYHCQA